MKKKLLTLLSILVLTSVISVSYCAQAVSSALSDAIKVYKAKDYAACYTKLNDIIEKDPSNALAYYYMAMTSAQLGKKGEAVENYEKAITLSSPNSNLNKYAVKGKRCLETPDKCAEEITETSALEQFINSKSAGMTDEIKSDYERLKIENMMREINRSDDIDPQEFKEYRDFSSYNQQGMPSNDEVVAAIRTLQKAGIYNIGNNAYSVNMPGSSSLSPQVIQALLTNNMSFGF